MSQQASATQEHAEDHQYLTELLMAISLATDLGTGQPFGHALRTCYLTTAIARELGCPPEAVRSALYVALLRFIGCTSDAAEQAAMNGGDDLAFNAAMAPALMGSGREQMSRFVRTVGADLPRLERFRLLGRALMDTNGAARTLSTHCEVGSMLARRLELPNSVVHALGHAYERWDGKGFPDGLRGDVIPLEIRIAVVARDADIFVRLGGEPIDNLRRRSGNAYDPTIVEAFARVGPPAIAEYDASDGWNAVLDCEPVPGVSISNARIDRVLHVLGDFVDLKSPWTRGHSPAVADLAAEAGARFGLDTDEQRTLRRAGLVHDIGRIGIENGIWDKPGPLNIEEWERVRLHPYLTQRILSRCRAITRLSELASSHHERLDGSGYHRACNREQLPMTARILAAADVFAAACAERPQRPAMTHAEAIVLLETETSASRLDGEAVACVLSAAGIRQPDTRQHTPAGLTEREIEVLRLIARGRTNRQVAEQLFISPKTVGRHVENIYGKAGVSTRAAAAVFAMEHRLLG